jgi:hypothetical protein
MDNAPGTLEIEIETSQIQRDAEGNVLPSTNKVKATATYAIGATLAEAVEKFGEAVVYRFYTQAAHADLEREANRLLRGSIRPALDPIKPKALQAALSKYALGNDRAAEAKLAKARAVLATLSEEDRRTLLG